jgi:N-formylglutamate amidohydrolase
MPTAVPPFVVRPPTAAAVPLVVSIPHTGTHLPPELAARLASDAMRALPMTDWHLHDLYAFLPALGVTTIHATWSRFYVDLNRAPDDRPLYPGRFETGLVARETFQGETIWREPPSAVEVERHRLRVHAPYHAELARLLEATRARHGRAWLIDAHSVASKASRLHPELAEQVFLGDRDGQTCPAAFIATVEQGFVAQGMTVVRNSPYKGGYITEHYGRLPGVAALQIEMAQRVYMDEDDPAGAHAHPRFARAAGQLRAVFEALVATL